MNVNVDILSGLQSTPKLIFKTNFGLGVSLDPVVMIGTAGDEFHVPNPIPGDWIQGWTYVKGTDSTYNYNCLTDLKAFFDSQSIFIIQQLPVAHLTDYTAGQAATTLATQFDVQIRNTTIPVVAGGKELLIRNIQRNGNGNPQASCQIIRFRDNASTPIPKIPSIAYRFDCILDSDINNITTSNYVMLTEDKTGDTRSSYPSGGFSSSFGSCRFNILIMKVAGGLYFSSRIDNNAGSVGVYPVDYNPKQGFYFAPFVSSSRQIDVGMVVRGATSGAMGTVSFSELRVNTWTGGSGKGVLVITAATGSFTMAGEVLQIQVGGVWTTACTATNLWTGLENKNLTNPEDKYRYNDTAPGTVPLNTPIRIEVRRILPASRDDITTGITQAVMTNLSTGARLTLCDFRGGIQLGALEDPITRFISVNAYTDYNLTAYPGDKTIEIQHSITNLEYWTDFPEEII